MRRSDQTSKMESVLEIFYSWPERRMKICLPWTSPMRRCTCDTRSMHPDSGHVVVLFKLLLTLFLMTLWPYMLTFCCSYHLPKFMQGLSGNFQINWPNLFIYSSSETLRCAGSRRESVKQKISVSSVLVQTAKRCAERSPLSRSSKMMPYTMGM